MFPLLKTESSEDLFQFIPPQAQAELNHWEKLVFSFDMDDEQSKRVSGNRDRARRGRSRSTSASGAGQSSSSGQPDLQDAALLAQLAAAAGIAQHSTHLGHQSYPPPLSQTNYPLSQSPFFPPDPLSQRPFSNMQLPPPSGMDFPWTQPPPLQPQLPLNQYSFNTLFPSYPYMLQPYGNLGPMGLGNSPIPAGSTGTPQQPQQPVASTSATTQDAPEVEGEHQALSEEKRRRNTAASARFRIKKKMRTTNLERSVSDLTGRAEELEREVADLRRENGWLKEIVMLKGTRLSGVEFPLQPPSQIAESSLAAAASRSLSSVEPVTPGSTASPVTTQAESDEEEEEEPEEEEVEMSSKSKGKRKAKAPSSKDTAGSKKDPAGPSK
ncbi:hypothetical protein BDN72DRAFT_873335 [Pluteus cervinus]|uniref:Uncharacterized protein n=1 Tax=Pluteus cervinus TaxID=181527 RepID=A0ACD3BGV7_9AGAR|nr:hypothetical protein BDN72DRAFT_873335 [Pluteus cervinus]